MIQEKISNSVDRWLQGDDTAFEAVFLYFRPRLLRYTFRYLKNETASEDLTTEVLVKAWQHKSSITNPATFENYLFTIARNKLIKRGKKE
jgi:RNA polymerase sigma-70 factor (ECF subfamily)